MRNVLVRNQPASNEVQVGKILDLNFTHAAKELGIRGYNISHRAPGADIVNKTMFLLHALCTVYIKNNSAVDIQRLDLSGDSKILAWAVTHSP